MQYSNLTITPSAALKQSNSNIRSPTQHFFILQHQLYFHTQGKVDGKPLLFNSPSPNLIYSDKPSLNTIQTRPSVRHLYLHTQQKVRKKNTCKPCCLLPTFQTSPPFFLSTFQTGAQTEIWGSRRLRSLWDPPSTSTNENDYIGAPKWTIQGPLFIGDPGGRLQI